MANFNYEWLVLTALIVHALSATSYVESAVDPSEIETCVRHLDERCGKEILLRVFFNDANPSVDCCMEITEMGKACHEKIVSLTLSSSPLYQKNSKAILGRSQSTWNHCLSTVRSSSPHNTSCPPVSNLTCAKQIVSRIFRSQGELSNDCCGVLVDIGKDCHDKLVGAHIASAKLRSNKTAILSGSTSVWNWCTYIAQSLPSVKACGKRIDNDCGREIGIGIFHGKGQVTKQCCAKLVTMGLKCHDILVKTNLARPQFVKSSNVTLNRSTKIWKKCISYI
ncbi:hypothetical protein ACJRO7_020492 [Eucalyptus globulus]|uniref:Prolamin-like domain-containing protein n=1 Tax=Eucalyptus globulus TaxID=34317 RepID=A0ABD3KGN5_EUCGL